MQASPGGIGDENASPEGSRATPDLAGYAQSDTADLAGADVAGPVVRRRRTGLWLGVGGAVVAAAVAVTLVLIFVVNRGSGWTLTATARADGFPRVNAAGLTSKFDSIASELKSSANRSPDIVHVSSTVVAAYNMNGSPGGADNLLVFVGLNGSFTSTAIHQMASALGAKMLRVKAGPHGGTARCGTAASGDEACYWATSTTMGMLDFNPLEAEDPSVLDALMIQMRNDLEKPIG